MSYHTAPPSPASPADQQTANPFARVARPAGLSRWIPAIPALRTYQRPWLAKDLTAHSLPEIGKAFGGRDHTTVMHACKQIREMVETDARMRDDWDKLVRLLSV